MHKEPDLKPIEHFHGPSWVSKVDSVQGFKTEGPWIQTSTSADIFPSIIHGFCKRSYFPFTAERSFDSTVLLRKSRQWVEKNIAHATGNRISWKTWTAVMSAAV